MEPQQTHNTHDHYFRESVEHPEIIKDICRLTIPKKLLSILDLTKLEIVHDVWVDNDLSIHYADVLYRARIKGKRQWVYLLFEHKSRINADVSYQILSYMMQIWEEYRKQSRRNLNKHPLVISTVLYHGYKPWKRCNTIKDITEVLTDAEDYVPEFRAKVFDVSELCETQLGKVSFYAQVFLISLRYSYHPEKWEILPELIQLYRKATGKQREYLSVSFKYILGLMNIGRKNSFLQRQGRMMVGMS
ncbi:MAG TPA: Rpn family recombination-promoting nuclease/putative transposase [Chitinispirillaceae bacterium]|nr:Rpn family recombination-promoting nuclease/putative transposase [Chitinispirillaceae bacterium]